MKLSIIIPCYNESKDIADNALTVKKYLDDKQIDHELILVNDGSKDNTKEVIESIPDVIPLSYEPNRGKGGAVKEGILHATGDYVLFMDADLSTDISAIEQVVEQAPTCDLLIGSRHAKGSVIKKKQPAIRVFIGWCCRLLVNMLFHTHLKDTQCGFKAMRIDVAKKLAEKQLINNFAFDVEYIFIANLNKLTIKELGVTWSDDRESTVSPFKSSIKFFKDLHYIKKNRKHYFFNEIDAQNDQGSVTWLIVLMIALLTIIIALFVVFLIVNGTANQ